MSLFVLNSSVHLQGNVNQTLLYCYNFPRVFISAVEWMVSLLTSLYFLNMWEISLTEECYTFCVYDDGVIVT